MDDHAVHTESQGWNEIVRSQLLSVSVCVLLFAHVISRLCLSGCIRMHKAASPCIKPYRAERGRMGLRGCGGCMGLYEAVLGHMRPPGAV